jgi:ethanolamine utilization protein EutN
VRWLAKPPGIAELPETDRIMQIARVLGHATATVKHDSMNGWKLIVLQPLDINYQPDDFPQLAIDPLGARKGDYVFFTSDTKYIHKLTGRNDSPIRFSVQGILDRVPESVGNGS